MSDFMPWDDRTKRRLKLRDLDVLLAVVETGSMGKAAKRLNISQPAVSKAVVELEDALGVRLLDRSRRGVVPTPYGLAAREAQRRGLQRPATRSARHRFSFRSDQGRNSHRNDRTDRDGNCLTCD